ncbi:hypothetical protein CP973_00265 [Streptomyces albofaciens JCM 4342]|uniref:hypothetical protein n=1 Tax=Streptomyces albofaciens TaxID=66866 RepID=UPI00123B899D|nr:hypothetical protein [Streptomyces albofaciens]KAA6220637.1 hypothetical protein CP973_00265 [Streptomyces albofaciens JCM 4342]
MSETGTASGQQGAPSADAGGTPPAAPPNSPPTAPADNAPTAPAADPAAEQRVSAAEQAAQQAATERDDLLAALRKVLDPEGADGEADPARLAEQAAAERDQARAEARQLRVELAAHQAAHTAGADPARLLDSRTVAQQLADLDPDDKAFGDKLAEVIKTAVEAAPHLRAAAPGPAKGGADFTGTTPERRPATLHDAIAARLGG